MSFTELVLVMAGMTAVLAVIWYFSRWQKVSIGDESGLPPGTRAFESKMSLPILSRMIEARELLLLKGELSDAERIGAETQIANMRKQAKLHAAVIAAGDLSPGKMSIGVNPDSDTID